MNKVCDLESIPSEKSEFGVWGGAHRERHTRDSVRGEELESALS